jgi:hypothetical protein
MGRTEIRKHTLAITDDPAEATRHATCSCGWDAIVTWLDEEVRQRELQILIDRHRLDVTIAAVGNMDFTIQERTS